MSTDEPIQDWKYWYEQALRERVEKMELERENERLRKALKLIEDVIDYESTVYEIAHQALESATDEN